MVFMPPQHGKSELVSRQLPAYVLGKTPKAKLVVASYSSHLSSGFNRDTQRIMESDEYKDVFPDTQLNEKNIVTVAGSWLRNSEIFETVGHGGFLKSVGVGGSLTGTAADFMIIDDPVKDSVEASSPTYQQRNWDWYNDVVYTRIHNDTGILITQTRWNVEDLSGKLLKQMTEGSGEQWTVLCLPSVKTDNSNPEDIREVGDALWPERHSLEKLMQVRSQSIRTFESLYQQDPKPSQAGGEIYHEFRSGVHTKPLKYIPELPLHVSFDFNVNPYMTCTVHQVVGKKAFQIDEICLTSPKNRTSFICKEIIKRYPNHAAGMFVYGDPNGVKEDTRIEKGHNDYTIIVRELKQFKPALRVFKAAPAVVMRINFINTVLVSGYQGCEISIGENCHKTIEEYQYCKEDSDGTKLKEKAHDTSTGATYEKYGHISDANDYFYTWIYAREFAYYSKGGADGQKTLQGKQANSKNRY